MITSFWNVLLAFISSPVFTWKKLLLHEAVPDLPTAILLRARNISHRQLDYFVPSLVQFGLAVVEPIAIRKHTSLPSRTAFNPGLWE